MMDYGYIIIGIAAALVSKVVQMRMMSTMKKLSKIRLSAGLSGRDVADRMLQDHGIHDVQITSVRGALTDHYNPLKRTVNLSDWVYSPPSIAAAAVAAHEVGHAVQHATKYPMLKFRSAIVPVLKFASPMSTIAIFAGLAMGMTQIAWLGVLMFAVGTAFALITLPVEFDASKRALAWMEESGLARGEEHELAKKGLKWAAMTYVVAALTSLAYLLYFINMLNRQD